MHPALPPYTLDPLVVAGASAYGSRFNLGDNTIFAIHAFWPAALVGTIGIAVSIDGENFENITESEQAVSAAGSFLWNYNGAGFVYARLYFTWTSGSGTITVKGNDKGRR